MIGGAVPEARVEHGGIMKQAQGKILLVEDERAHVELIRRAFREVGRKGELEVAGSLHDALRWLDKKKPALAVIDLQLPDGSGFDLFERGGAGKDFPAIVLSAHGDEVKAVEALKKGAADYIVKDEALFSSLPRICESAMKDWQHIQEKSAIKQELLESNRTLSAALKIAGLGVWSYDPLTQQPSWSPRMFEIFGIDPSKGVPCFEAHRQYIHPEDWERFAATVQKGDGYRLKLRIVRPDGAVRRILTLCEPQLDADGRMIKLYGTAADITEQERNEESLTKLIQCFLSLGADGRENIRRIVHCAGEILGWACLLYNRLEDEELLCTWAVWQEPPEFVSREKPHGHICYDVIASGTQKPVIIKDLTGSKYETTDPNVRKYDLKAYTGIPVFVGECCVGSFCAVDVSVREPSPYELRMMEMLAHAVSVEEERLRTQRRADEALKRFQLAMKGTSDGLWDWNLVTNEVYFSPRWKSMLGYADDEIPKTFEQWEQRIHPDDVDRVKSCQDDYLAGRTEKLEVEFRIYHRDEGYIPVLARAYAVRDDDRRPRRLVGTLIDMRGMKEMEEAVRQERNFLVNILESLSYPFYVIDPQNYEIQLANSASHTNGTSVGFPCYRVTHGRTTPCREDEHPCPLKEVRTKMKPVVVEHVHMDKKGRRRDVEVHAFPVIDGEGKLQSVIEYAIDITDRKEAEEVLRDKILEVQRANEIMLGREGRVVELKREINMLLSELGRREKYTI